MAIEFIIPLKVWNTSIFIIIISTTTIYLQIYGYQFYNTTCSVKYFYIYYNFYNYNLSSNLWSSILYYYTSCKNLLISLDNRHLTFLNSFFWWRNQIIITPSAVISPSAITPAPSEFCWLVISGMFVDF